MTSQGENSGSLKQLRHEGEIHGLVAAKAKRKNTPKPLQRHFKATFKVFFFFRQNKKGVFDLFRFAAKQRESNRGSCTPLTFFIRGGKNGFW